jgi:hypothetical protein
MKRLLVVHALGLILVGVAVQSAEAALFTATSEPETSATWPAGDVEVGLGSTSDTADPLGPFSGQVVHFRGTGTGGNTTDTLNGASLVYRYRLEFPSPHEINSIQVDGAAFNGPDSVLRLLDSGMNLIASETTDHIANGTGSIFMAPGNPVGTVFFLEEYDTSTAKRVRSNITLTAIPEPSTLLLAGLGLLGLLSFRRRRS